MTASTTIGVLAVQGDVREHAHLLERCGAQALSVRRLSELNQVDGLVIPGGESTTIDKLLRHFGLHEPLQERIQTGLPVYGSCAGLICLATQVLDGTSDQQTLGGMDISVRRNAFGRQVDSFEVDLSVQGIVEPERALRAVFIRAPWVERVGESVQVLASVPGPDGQEPRAVAVRQGSLLGTSFHPEITDDARVHDLFVRMVRGAA